MYRYQNKTPFIGLFNNTQIFVLGLIIKKLAGVQNFSLLWNTVIRSHYIIMEALNRDRSHITARPVYTIVEYLLLFARACYHMLLLSCGLYSSSVDKLDQAGIPASACTGLYRQKGKINPGDAGSQPKHVHIRGDI
jgi:hypothetical protein